MQALEKKQKKKSPGAMQRDLKEMLEARQSANPPSAPDMKKTLKRVGLIVAAAWVIAAMVQSAVKTWWPTAVAGTLTVLVAGALIYFMRLLKNQQAIGALLSQANSSEGRKDALKRLETEFKKDDVQAVIARSQIEMQEDPKKAISTLETIDLSKQMQPVADQVRTMRAMMHLTQGEAKEARMLVDQVEMSKQQDLRARAMFAAVAAEAWGRTGQAKKGVDVLELFNPDDPELAEFQIQLYRARAFAFAGANDMKSATRAMKKLAEMNPQLLGMFVMGKKVHPLLQREAQQIVARSGGVPRKVVYKRS